MAYFFRLDHRARLLAVFSPKCASTTLRDWLQALDRREEPQDAQQPEQPFFVLPRQVENHRNYFDRYGDYVKVLFLRDPLRRLVSFYAHWVIRKPGYWSFADHDRRFWLDRKSFRRFFYALDHLHRNRLRFQHHLEPQLDRTAGIEFDRVVLVEHLRPGLQALNQLLGFDYLPPQATRTPYDAGTAEPVADRAPQWFRQHAVPETRWFLDPELLELAENLYADDVAAYRRHGGETVGSDLTGHSPVASS